MKLTAKQTSVLAALREHGYWHGGHHCGWAWDGDTKQVMDALVRRGFARIDESMTLYNRAVYLPVEVSR